MISEPSETMAGLPAERALVWCPQFTRRHRGNGVKLPSRFAFVKHPMRRLKKKKPGAMTRLYRTC